MPPAEFHDNVNETIAFLDDARDVGGVSLVLTNLWRSEAKNAQLAAEGYSAAKNSQHKRGRAFDVVPVGMTPFDWAAAVVAAQLDGRLPRAHQIIVYDSGDPQNPDNHVHGGLAGEGWKDDLQILLHTSTGEYVALTAGKLDALAQKARDNPGVSAVALLGVGVLAFFFPALVVSSTALLTLRG